MKKKCLNLLMLLVGNMMIAYAIANMVLKNNIIAGGVSGLGVVCHYYLGIPVSLLVMMINVGLFILGFVFLGKRFAMTSLVSSLSFPMMLQFFEVHHELSFKIQDMLLTSCLAGALIGVGIGLVMKANASTGGLDIIALIIEKYWGIAVHLVLNVIDVMILLLQFSFHDSDHVVYGIVVVMVTTLMLNKTLTSGQSLIQVLVMSDACQDIQNMILHDIDAGVTLLDSHKGYSQVKSQVILTILPYRKLPLFKQKVHQLDHHAFMIVSHVDEVGGRGFSFDVREYQKTISS